MTAGILSDLNQAGHSLFGQLTSYIGDFRSKHKHETTTQHTGNFPTTFSAATTSSIQTTSSIPLTSVTSLSSFTQSPTNRIPSSPFTFSSQQSSHSLATSSLLTTTSTYSPDVSAETPTTTLHTHAPTKSANGPQFYFIGLLFITAICLMLALLCIAPFVLRFFKFASNFVRMYFDRSGGNFGRDFEVGLNSEAFDLQDNIDREDMRHGLDKKAKLRILWYMFWFEEPFDEARLRYVRYQFSLNGIGEDGQPLDPKYIRT